MAMVRRRPLNHDAGVVFHVRRRFHEEKRAANGLSQCVTAWLFVVPHIDTNPIVLVLNPIVFVLNPIEAI